MADTLDVDGYNRELTNAVKSAAFRSAGSNPIPLNTWENFYSKVMPPKPQSVPMLQPIEYSDILLDSPISILELDGALKDLKNNKSPGIDGPSNELW
ncbi:unnamed protein product [Allacma fusca]|uniref:Reverse transcriptase domain-containing protein n=1 Tax=Allacma fusca TaxID=39272 RepID=A0A8J2P8B9_9HEXA|nr:unnamed protein product [Allacma fusca]